MTSQDLFTNGQLNRSAAAESLQIFLQEIIRTSKLDLIANVTALPAGTTPDAGSAEMFANLNGRDKELLLERGAELLQAIEHLALRALRLEPPWQANLFFHFDPSHT